jgi:hypothetical protein
MMSLKDGPVSELSNRFGGAPDDRPLLGIATLVVGWPSAGHGRDRKLLMVIPILEIVWALSLYALFLLPGAAARHRAVPPGPALLRSCAAGDGLLGPDVLFRGSHAFGRCHGGVQSIRC